MVRSCCLNNYSFVNVRSDSISTSISTAFYVSFSEQAERTVGSIFKVNSLTLFGIRLSKIYIYICTHTHTHTPRVFIAFSTLRFGFPSLILSEIETPRSFAASLSSLWEKRSNRWKYQSVNEPTGGRVSVSRLKTKFSFSNASQSLIARAILLLLYQFPANFYLKPVPRPTAYRNVISIRPGLDR